MKSPIRNIFAAHRRVWGMGMTAAALAMVCGSNVLAQMSAPFSAGNLVVDRFGNGTGTLTSAGTPIFLDQYTPGGALVSSQMIPTNGASAFTDSGTASTEGFLSLNPFGTNVVLAGYNVPAGFAAPNSATSLAAPRGVATVDYNGNFRLITVDSNAFSGSNIRSATGDGTTNYWGSSGITGVIYLGTGPSNTISTTVANERVVQAIGGNLYFSTGSGTTRGVYKITGLPISGANTAVSLLNNGGSAAPNGFAFSPAFNLAYVADTTTFSTSSGIGGIERWALVSGTWTFQYSIAPGVGNGASGIAVDWTTTPATIYATTANGNYLVSVQDTGSSVIAVTNATAPGTSAFRSVSLAPTNATVVPQAPVITGINPTGPLTVPLTTAITFTLSGFSGSPIGSNFWYKVSNSVTYLIPGQTGTTLTISNLALTDSSTYYAVVSNATAAVASPLVALTVTPAPFIASITPSTVATNPGANVTFTLNGSPGNPTANFFWFYVTNGLTNPAPAGIQTVSSLTLTNVAFTNAGGYFCILTNNFGAVTSSIATLVVSNFPPVITSLTPLTVVTNAGQNVTFTATNAGTGPFTYFWYKNAATTNLLATTTNASFTLTDVLTNNSGHYQVVVSNITTITVTSQVASLTVTGDPAILVEPSSTMGFAGGTVQFTVVAAATSPTYQWYITDTNGNFKSQAVSLGDGSVISGATSSTLTVANLQPTDLTNFVVVVANTFGSVTSTVASILGGPNNVTINGPYEGDYQGDLLPTNGALLAFWDFDGLLFTNTSVNPNCLINPTPALGNGTAAPVGTTFNPVSGGSPFAGATDPADVGFDAIENAYAFTPYGFEQPSPNNSWGLDNFPAVTGTNKLNGAQFNISTVGARNIKINYDARVSSTTSEFWRLQYTTNGTTWIDYPASSSFDGLTGSGNAGFYPFNYDLTGYPGVDNNPAFGIRIVSEWQSTATYGIGTTNFWVGAANLYNAGATGNSAGGTFTLDLVAITGDAITNNNQPPSVGFVVGGTPTIPTTSYLSPTNSYTYYATNVVDTNTLKIPFTASSPQSTPLTVTAAALNQVSAGVFANPVNASYTVTSLGSTNYLLTIAFNSYIPDPMDASPVVITATDANGLSGKASFVLTAVSINQPPTNTLTAFHGTNILANVPVTLPFTVGSGRDAVNTLTVQVTSDNNTVIPSGNISISGANNNGGGNFTVNNGTGNLTLSFTPAPEQVGEALITVAVSDNDPIEPRTTTAFIPVTVQPNTNVIAIDYFNYDNNGPLDTLAQGYWQHLSGLNNQLRAGGGVATVSSGNTENLEAPLVGAPYSSNSSAILYYSATINVSPSGLPTGTTYFLVFNDGTDLPANTGNVEDCLVITTNATANGYRLGIANRTASTAQIFPIDLQPGVTYFIVTALQLNNGHSTLWLSPTNQASASLTDTTTISPLYNIGAFELRESGTVEGTINVGSVLVGTTFNSVFYPPQANPEGIGITENTTTLVSALANDGGSNLRITSVTPDANSTASISGTNISVTPVANFIGTSTISYTVTDDVSNTASATITVVVTNNPPVANPDHFTVAVNSVNNALTPLANDVEETPGGALALTSVSETDGDGTATQSGNNVIFTPNNGFSGTATISYTVSDGVGGTANGTITVDVGTVSNVPLTLQLSGGNETLNWNNSPFVFTLQVATNVAGPYVSIPGATPPYTIIVTTNAAGFYRLVH